MLKALLLAPVAFVGLASASPPPMSPVSADEDYPPCSASVTDRCIQTYERHRRHAMREAYGPAPMPAPGPVQMAGDYPPCSATVTDRCQQGVGRRVAAPTRYARWERQRVMMGERG
jgi:hypothetical protein